jgi:hypothetical protein
MNMISGASYSGASAMVKSGRVPLTSEPVDLPHPNLMDALLGEEPLPRPQEPFTRILDAARRLHRATMRTASLCR